MKFKFSFITSIVGLFLISCSEDSGLMMEDEIQDELEEVLENPGDIQEIAALPLMPNYPASNPASQEKEELGRLLFWDPVLSGNFDVSCGTCHHPDHAYADGLERSIGVGGIGIGPDRRGGSLIDRNSPTILNTAYNGIGLTDIYSPERSPMFWDNRESSLESQSIQPILSAIEMRGNDIAEGDIVDVVIGRLEAIPEYAERFEVAFGSTQITEEMIAAAIATFERTLIANNSRFDQYMRGNANILTQQELNGLDDFIEAGCANCHSGAMLSDFELHTLSVPNNGINDAGANGRFDFRTPTLRNVSLTAPYMHNGAFETLDDVMDFYQDISRGNGNSQNNNVADNQIANDARNLNLNNNRINNIIAFLNTLTDNDFDRTIPNTVPSDNIGR